jgi:alpha-glucosidase (family GH31 glycosyl hydrolase)
MKFADRFVALAKECAKTGEPMLRNLEYCFPGNGWENVNDQFMIGDFLMVAPQVQKGARTRTVAVPPGKWRADDGTVVTGPSTITVDTPVTRLPYFERIVD